MPRHFTASFKMSNIGISTFTSSSNSSSEISNNNSSFPMSNNNSNFSIPVNKQNGSVSPNNGQSGNSNSLKNSVSNFIVLPTLSLTIIFAIAYIILVLIRPTFRTNKINWFIINVCLTTTLLSTIMLSMTTAQIMGTSNAMSCHAQSFLTVMAASQMMYSHSIIAISRLLTIVYSNKRLFRSIACTFMFIICGWLVAFIIAIPFVFLDGFSCSGSTKADFLPYYTLFGVLIIPIMIVLLCNIRIFLFVRRSTQRVHTEGRGNNASQARDLRLVKTMIATFTVFVAGWIPVFVEQVFKDHVSVSTTVDTVFQILPPFSMFFDVILLIYTNQPVRLFLWQSIMHRHQINRINPMTNIAKAKTHTVPEH